ncbi:MAG: MurR/RpiR family transcriptional regulator [Clostridia bacterium]|nr:MurR/RpiR family transcriptional regulator [Clostridia bacterium]
MENIFNILSTLRANFEFYSAVETKIANAVLTDPHKFITYSMTELSETLGVSQGSINNFARKVAGVGFAAFKLQIAKELPNGETHPFTPVKDSDGIKDILQKNISDLVTTFHNTYNLNSEQSMKNAASMILGAKRIELYGIFNSGITANSFYYQLVQLGLPAYYISDVLISPVSASLLDKDSLIIAVSSSGKTKDIIDTVKIAKAQNVPVITITSNKNSPLAKLSNEVLITASSGNYISNSKHETQVSQLLIANTICSYIQSIVDKDGENRYFKLYDILDSHSVND